MAERIVSGDALKESLMVLPDVKLHLLGIKCSAGAICSVFDEYHEMYLHVFGKSLGA